VLQRLGSSSCSPRNSARASAARAHACLTPKQDSAAKSALLTLFAVAVLATWSVRSRHQSLTRTNCGLFLNSSNDYVPSRVCKSASQPERCGQCRRLRGHFAAYAQVCGQRGARASTESALCWLCTACTRMACTRFAKVADPLQLICMRDATSTHNDGLLQHIAAMPHAEAAASTNSSSHLHAARPPCAVPAVPICMPCS
jgi:hypothetical protein